MKQVRSRIIHNCDMCGESTFREVARPDDSGSAVLMCENCTLFFASPTLELTSFEHFYDQEFLGDVGSKAAQAAGKKDNSKKDGRRARDWAMPIVEKFIPSLNGKRILDLRSRDGALAEAMSKSGAVVTATDPMKDNITKIATRGLNAVYLPIAEHAHLKTFPDKSFDAVTALTVHLMSHLPEPTAFLRSAYRTLSPGGLLILDEKDVLKPNRVQSNTVFDDVGGHLFQFTFDTLRNMVERAGFEIVMYSYDPPRFSKFRHMVLVARRPLIEGSKHSFTPHPTARLVLKQLEDAQRWLWLKAPFNRAIKAIKRLF